MCEDITWKYLVHMLKKKILYALNLPFVCLFPCSYDTETNHWPRAKDMAMSFACV